MRSETSLGRGVAIIVVAGAALGLAYNWAGLASRPARGIPWVAVGEDLPTLESLLPPDSAAVAPVATAPAATAPADSGAARSDVTPAAPAPAAPAAPAPARAAAPKPLPAAPKRNAGQTPDARASAPADSTPTVAEASDPAAPPPPDTRRTAPVTFIPEIDRPIQIKLATAKGLFDAGAALFLDAREPSEFDAGHIPGAMRMTRGDALGDPDRVKALGAPTRPIVTYCEGGACEASLELARVLVDAGYRKVLVYAGGFPEWAGAGHPVERGGNGR
jgi:rhodanese-related sulfurtransferase